MKDVRGSALGKSGGWIFGRLYRMLAKETMITKAKPGWALTAHGLFVGLLFSAILYAGPVAQRVFGHDIFAALEGGWKICQGYRPYVDFHTLMGPLTHLIMALGVALEGPTAWAFPVSIALTLLPVAFLAWRIAVVRLRPALCLLACTYLCLVWVAPYPMHFRYSMTSYAMMYNRQSYVVLSLLALALLLPGRAEYRNSNGWSLGWLAGFLTGLLFFFKITYFTASSFLLFYALLTGRLNRREVLRGICGFAIVFVPMWIYLEGAAGFSAMLEVYRVAAAVRTHAVYLSSVNLVICEFPQPLCFAISALMWLIVINFAGQPWIKLDPGRRWNCLVWIFEFVTVIATSIFAEMGGNPDGDRFDIPLLAIYGLVLLERILTLQKSVPGFARLGYVSAGVASCALIILPLWKNMAFAVIHIVKDRISPPGYVWSSVIDSPGFSDIRIYGTCGNYPKHVTYVDKINDGLNLIRRHPELDHATVATLDFSDGFSCPLGRASPRHMPLGLHYGVMLNERIYPKPEVIFAGCDGLMIPKYPDSPFETVPLLLKQYNDYILKRYVVYDQTELWWLCVAKTVTEANHAAARSAN